MTISTPQALAIYSVYPRRVKKPLAIRAILKAIERDGYEAVRAGTVKYAARVIEIGAELNYVPHPSTFYNQEQYNDDIDALLPLPKAKSANGVPVWAQIDALKALIEKAKRAIPDVPSRWLCSKAEHDKAIAAREPFVAEKRRLGAQLEQLQRKLAEGL